MLRLLFVLLFSINSFAMLILNIELMHEKGLDDQMILKSELFSKEIIYSDKVVSLQMKNGIRLDVRAKFEENSEEFGPSSIFKISGELKNINFEKPKQGKFRMEAKINEPQTIVINSVSGQKITLTITPVLK